MQTTPTDPPNIAQHRANIDLLPWGCYSQMLQEPENQGPHWGLWMKFLTNQWPLLGREGQVENCEQESLTLGKRTWSVKATRWGRGQRPTGVTVGAERPFLGVFPCTGHFGSHNLVQQALASPHILPQRGDSGAACMGGCSVGRVELMQGLVGGQGGHRQEWPRFWEDNHHRLY